MTRPTTHEEIREAYLAFFQAKLYYLQLRLAAGDLDVESLQ